MKKHRSLKYKEGKLKNSGKEENVNYTKGYICKLTNATRNTYFKQKNEILRDKLNTGNSKSKILYKITKSLTSDASENTLPTATPPKELTNTFAIFFVDKVNKIRSKFQNDENYQIQTRNCKTLLNFQTITEEELIKTIKTMKSTSSSNDPCNTEFLLNFTQMLVPIWTNIINKSIEEGTVLKC